MKHFWIIFLKDPETGTIHGTAHGHNCVADYRGNPYFVGWKAITVDIKELAQ